MNQLILMKKKKEKVILVTIHLQLLQLMLINKIKQLLMKLKNGKNLDT